MKAEISLGDGRYFHLFIGDRVLQSKIYNIEGDIPIYSANVMKPFGYSDVSNIDDFSHDHILWGIDGDFKFNIVPSGTKFATTDHCGAISVLDERIVPEYLIFGLEVQSHLLEYDRTLRPTLTRMKKLKVKVPLDKDGSFDVETQKLAIGKYKILRDIRKEIEVEISRLSSTHIFVPPPQESIEVGVKDLFDLSQKTNRSWFTRKFIDENKGDIPVYSASKEAGSIDYGYVRDNIDGVRYFHDVLTWNIDGSTGRAFYRKGKFTLSEKVIPLILRDKWVGFVDLNYVRYMLEQESLTLELGFSTKAGKGKLEKISVKLPCVSSDGETPVPDIRRQQQVAATIEQAYTLKQDLVGFLSELSDISIDI